MDHGIVDGEGRPLQKSPHGGNGGDDQSPEKNEIK